jgi:hypothetical protein
MDPWTGIIAGMSSIRSKLFPRSQGDILHSLEFRIMLYGHSLRNLQLRVRRLLHKHAIGAVASAGGMAVLRRVEQGSAKPRNLHLSEIVAGNLGRSSAAAQLLLHRHATVVVDSGGELVVLLQPKPRRAAHQDLHQSRTTEAVLDPNLSLPLLLVQETMLSQSIMLLI